MGKKIKTIIALLVDDDDEFSQSIKRSAKAKGIIFFTAHNLPEMKKILPEIAKRVATIVLDIKGLKEENQIVDKADFVQAALKFIQGNMNYKDIPICLLTGDSDKYKEFRELYSDIDLFLKTTEQRENLFSKIRENSITLEQIKLRLNLNDVFSPLQVEYDNKNLNTKLADLDNELMLLLKNYTEGEKPVIRNNLVQIRRMQEIVFQCLKILDKRLLPKTPYTPKGNINFSEWDFHHTNHEIEGKEICSGVINLLRTPIYVLSCEDGAHVPFLDSTYPPTKYTVQALTFALLDFLKWFGMLLTKYHKKNSI